MKTARQYPLRIRFVGARVIHAAYFPERVVEGHGMTACYRPFLPTDYEFPAGTPVDCSRCLQLKSVREQR